MADRSQGTTLVREEQLVVFHLDREVYGVDIAHVHEIIRLQEITRIPRTPAFIEGVINLRGRVIPVIDLRTRFGLERGERNGATRIIVVEVGGHTVGMVVDGVSEVLRLSTDAIAAPSEILTAVDVAYMRGVGKLEDRLVILLDLQEVLTRSERQDLAAMSTPD